MSNSLKRSMDRDNSPVSKRSRSGYPADVSMTRERFSPPNFDRRDSHRGKYDPRDVPPPPGPGYRTEFLVHDGPPPPRQYDSRGFPPAGPFPGPPRWAPENDYRSLYISGIPHKIPDQQVRDCLVETYKRFGEMNVKVTMSNEQRVAYLNFRYPEDARDALMRGAKFLFDRELKINPVFNKRRNNLSPSRNGPPVVASRPPPDQYYPNRHSPPPYDRRLPPPDELYAPRDEFIKQEPGLPPSGGSIHEGDRKSEKFPYHLDHVDPEYDDKATRTLFVGNLDVNIIDLDLRNIFGKFGMVEDVDIKRPVRNSGNAYAFIKFINLDCAHRAKVEMSGKYIGRFQCKIGYGKVTATTVVWVGGLGPWVTVETLEREFDRFGAIRHIEWPRNKNFAYVIYDSIDAAQAACQQMRGYPMGGPERRLRLDFGEKEHISRSHSLPDYFYPPMKGYSPHPDNPPDPWRGPPPDGPDRQRYEDWQRDQRNYRAPPPEAYREDAQRQNDYRHDHSVERRRERTPEHTKPSYHVGQRSPERGREYRDSRGQPREEDRHLSERRDYRAASPHGDYSDIQCRTLADLTKLLPVAWNGALILKSSAFATRMHVVGGDVTLVDTLMRDPTSTESPVLKITQRLRLDQPKLDDVGRRIQSAGPRGHCILLAVPSSLTNYEDNAATIQQRPLKNLVTYLKQKEAAGVISLPPFPFQGKKDVGVLHAFPPCDFGFNFLKNRAPKLSPETTKEDHLVIVVVNGAA